MAVLFLTLRPSAARHATLHLEVFDLFIHRIRTTCVVLVIALGIAATASAEQTIVFFRHAEKPASGLGNLTCQGLNRALALPAVLLGRFGTPDFVYAPNPSQKVSDSTGSYYYVRPLATIEPTAIRAARSVNTHYGYTDIGSL